MHFQTGSASHTGCVRDINQDSIGVFQSPVDNNRNNLPLFIVADGMGGHLGGEVASSTAVAALHEAFRSNHAGQTPGEALRAAILAANATIYARAEATQELRGMGTTIVAAVATDSTLYIGNVGDSRAYLVRQEHIQRLTEDHSFIEDQVRAGKLSQEEAKHAPGRNMLTRAVGRHARIDVDIYHETWTPGDQLLLCSDGLWGVVPEEELLACILDDEPQAAADELVEHAMNVGSRDNISAIIIRHTIVE